MTFEVGNEGDGPLPLGSRYIDTSYIFLFTYWIYGLLSKSTLSHTISTYVHTYLHIHTCYLPYLPTYLPTYIHTYIHTHTHIYITLSFAAAAFRAVGSGGARFGKQRIPAECRDRNW